MIQTQGIDEEIAGELNAVIAKIKEKILVKKSFFWLLRLRISG